MKHLLLITLFIINCNNSNVKISENNINSMIPLTSNTLLSRDSDKILVQDYINNKTIVYNISSEILSEINRTYPLSFFSLDKENVFHVNENYEVFSESYPNLNIELNNMPLDIAISEANRKIVIIERTEEVNVGQLIIRSFDNSDHLVSTKFPLLDIHSFQSNNELDFVAIHSQSSIGNDEKKFVHNPKNKHPEFIEYYGKSPNQYNHWLFKNTQIVSDAAGLHIWNFDNYKLLEASPNQSCILSPDRKKILIYRLAELKDGSKLKVNYIILDLISLNTLKEGSLKLESTGMPLLLLYNDYKIHQVIYENNNIQISLLE